LAPSYKASQKNYRMKASRGTIEAWEPGSKRGGRSLKKNEARSRSRKKKQQDGRIGERGSKRNYREGGTREMGGERGGQTPNLVVQKAFSMPSEGGPGNRGGKYIMIAFTDLGGRSGRVIAFFIGSRKTDECEPEKEGKKISKC